MSAASPSKAAGNGGASHTPRLLRRRWRSPAKYPGDRLGRNQRRIPLSRLRERVGVRGRAARRARFPSPETDLSTGPQHHSPFHPSRCAQTNENSSELACVPRCWKTILPFSSMSESRRHGRSRPARRGGNRRRAPPQVRARRHRPRETASSRHGRFAELVEHRQGGLEDPFTCPTGRLWRHRDSHPRNLPVCPGSAPFPVRPAFSRAASRYPTICRSG